MIPSRSVAQSVDRTGWALDRFFYDLTHRDSRSGGVIRTQNNTPLVQHGFARF